MPDTDYREWPTLWETAADLAVSEDTLRNELGKPLDKREDWAKHLHWIQNAEGLIFEPASIDAASRALDRARS